MIRWVSYLMMSSGTAFACDAIGEPMVSDEKNAPVLYVKIDEVPLAQPFSMRITLCGEWDVNELRVDATMPAHKHGMNYTPSVSALESNVFEIEGILFHMPGMWEMRIDLATSERDVYYTYPIALK